MGKINIMIDLLYSMRKVGDNSSDVEISTTINIFIIDLIVQPDMNLFTMFDNLFNIFSSTLIRKKGHFYSLLIGFKMEKLKNFS